MLPLMTTDHIWYASYGSNLSAARFGFYLSGGRPPGASRTYPGARDTTPPVADRALHVPGEIFFGWDSPTWGGGGIAFLDLAAGGEALVRAYRITHEQLADVVAQEMHRDPGDALDVDELIGARRLVLGPGRYETLAVVADIEGEPVVTFTCPDDDARPAVNAPSGAYLAMIAAGLREAHGLSTPQIRDYLLPAPGMRPTWTPERLDEVLAA